MKTENTGLFLIQEPLLEYKAEEEISNLSWSML
jgi:hypothetical protein